MWSISLYSKKPQNRFFLRKKKKKEGKILQYITFCSHNLTRFPSKEVDFIPIKRGKTSGMYYVASLKHSERKSHEKNPRIKKGITLQIVKNNITRYQLATHPEENLVALPLRHSLVVKSIASQSRGSPISRPQHVLLRGGFLLSQKCFTVFN